MSELQEKENNKSKKAILNCGCKNRSCVITREVKKSTDGTTERNNPLLFSIFKETQSRKKQKKNGKKSTNMYYFGVNTTMLLRLHFLLPNVLFSHVFSAVTFAPTYIYKKTKQHAERKDVNI